MIERESKLVLTPKAYDALRAAGRLVECRKQLNVYLHDPQRLAEELGYFRIRYESGREPVATLKIQMGWRGGMREMGELERPLAGLGPALYPRPRRRISVAEEVPEPFRAPLLSWGVRRLVRLGWMRNQRCVVELAPHGCVELDRTRLPDGREHLEVEIEHPVRETHRSLLKEVRRLAPSARPTRVGKFTRFLEASGLA